tara:strand:- start:2206 stop:2838 length:633 start_codon:yes stop_codon:yes gene_type:complete
MGEPVSTTIAVIGLMTSVAGGIYSGLQQSEMAERQNEAIEAAKKRAARNLKVQAGQHQKNRDLLTRTALRKADYAALQESSARAVARGRAKAALSAGGRVASAGTSSLALLEQIELKSSWKQYMISEGANIEVQNANNAYDAAMIGATQQYEEQWFGMDNQLTNSVGQGFGSGLAGFGGGLSMTASGLSIYNSTNPPPGDPGGGGGAPDG